jgi:predicted O-linked N-acetylglucosamine transferase (SPINDLY family)
MLKKLLADLRRRRALEAAAAGGELEQAIRLLQLQDDAGAALLCEQVVSRDPGSIKAWELLGAAALNLGDYPLACERFDRVLALAGEDAQALANAAEANRRADRCDRALELIRRALALQPGTASFLHIQVLCLEGCWRSEEALAACREALRLHPDFAQLHISYMTLLNRACADPALVLDAHCEWARRFAPGQAAARHDNPPQPERRLRIGYVSGDFRAHAVSHFILPLLEHHDPARVEVYCYSNTAKTDAISRRCEALASHWREIVALSDAAAEALIRRDGIDILVDLSGHTIGNRLPLFARKPAPVQATYLGYPASTGLAQMDYRITDARTDPPEAAHGSRYREQLLRLPNSLWCFAPPPQMPAVGALPAQAAGHITFGSLNSALKLTPRLLALWAQLLHVVPASKLVLATIAEGAPRARIAREFESNGVDPARLEFHGFLSWQAFWDLHRRIDIALDSFPCNGGATTCETLWLGVPLVTLAGEAFLSRAGLSLLSTVGLSELVAHSAEDYLRIARDLAGERTRLAQLRAGIRQRMRASPLLDAAAFARDLEDAYRSAWRRWCAGPAAEQAGGC